MNGLSIYSLHHGRRSPTYHPIHITQLLQLHTLTGGAEFAQMASVLRSDHPTDVITGRAWLTPRLVRVHQSGHKGVVRRSRGIDIAKARLVHVDLRRQTAGGPALRIAAGRHAGWWVRERAGRAWAVEPGDAHGYATPLTAVFQPGHTYTGYRYGRLGRRTGSVTFRATRSSTAPTSMSAIVEGRPAFFFDTGAFAGTWVAMADLPYR